jgi:hypothetical protein
MVVKLAGGPERKSLHRLSQIQDFWFCLFSLSSIRFMYIKGLKTPLLIPPRRHSWHNTLTWMYQVFGNWRVPHLHKSPKGKWSDLVNCQKGTSYRLYILGQHGGNNWCLEDRPGKKSRNRNLYQPIVWTWEFGRHEIGLVVPVPRDIKFSSTFHSVGWAILNNRSALWENPSAGFRNTAWDNLNGKIRSVPFDSILCDYSVAFWDGIHLFEPSGARLRAAAVDKFSYIPKGRSISDFCSSALSNNYISSLTSCESGYSFWVLASSHSPPQKVQLFEFFHNTHPQLLN